MDIEIKKRRNLIANRRTKLSKKLYITIVILVLSSLILAACAAAEGATQKPATQNTAVNAAAGSVQINGAGATFPLPVYTEWTYAYQYVDPSVAINYQGIGSGGGKKGIVDRTIDFAGSDSLLKDEEYTNGVDLQMIPMLAGAVVPIFNLKGYDIAKDPPLVLDRQTLADIFLGKIKTWNDPAIIKLNPELSAKLADSQITAVHRSDGSGTTEIFTNALAAFSEEWQTNVGAGSAVEWPVDKTGNGVGGKGNQGVAGSVQNTPNSIGYVELSYAVENKIPFAQMINKAGKVVQADDKSLAAAMNDFANSFSDKLTTKIVDGPGESSWPISGYTYMILHTKSMEDCVKAEKLLNFLNWALTDPAAAKRAAELGYSVLPDAVRTQVLGKLAEVTCQDKPVLK